jgi:hypothetical protein
MNELTIVRRRRSSWGRSLTFSTSETTTRPWPYLYAVTAT